MILLTAGTELPEKNTERNKMGTYERESETDRKRGGGWREMEDERGKKKRTREQECEKRASLVFNM